MREIGSTAGYIPSVQNEALSSKALQLGPRQYARLAGTVEPGSITVFTSADFIQGTNLEATSDGDTLHITSPTERTTIKARVAENIARIGAMLSNPHKN